MTTHGCACQRLDQIESEMIRLRAALNQRLREVEEIRSALKSEADIENAKGELRKMLGSTDALIRPLEEVEKAAILRAVRLKPIPVAAVLLGIGKTTLYRKLSAYGISPRTISERIQDLGSEPMEAEHAGI